MGQRGKEDYWFHRELMGLTEFRKTRSWLSRGFMKTTTRITGLGRESFLFCTGSH